MSLTGKTYIDQKMWNMFKSVNDDINKTGSGGPNGSESYVLHLSHHLSCSLIDECFLPS